MTFNESDVEAFLTMFKDTKGKISNFKGCQHLVLLRDADQPYVFMTYSIWENKEALEAYRHSTLFKTTWQKTKKWFSARPVAFSAYEEN
jgi:heme-degrading monooxygenase HmoA